MEDLYGIIQEKTSNSIIDVCIRASFTKIYNVDTQNQRFEAEAIIESKWFDPNIDDLSYNTSELKWKPEIYIDNSINDPKEQIVYKVFIENGTIMVSEIRKVKGIFSENLELEMFPLDIQSLTLLITSKNSSNRINFKLMQPETEKLHINSILDKSMWHMHDQVKAVKTNISREYSFGKRDYPSIEVSCQVFRHCGYFHWNGLLPILLITLCSLAPFVLEYNSISARIGTSASMLLSSVSYKIAVSRLLPTVSYLTSLDKYCIGSIVIITCMLLYHGLLGLLLSKFDIEFLIRLDQIAFMVSLGIFMGKQFFYICWLIKINCYRTNLIKKSIFHGVKNNLNEIHYGTFTEL